MKVHRCYCLYVMLSRWSFFKGCTDFVGRNWNYSDFKNQDGEQVTSGRWPCAGTGHWATRRQLFCPQELTARLQERKAGLGTGREEQETAIFVKKPLTVLWPVELYACGLCWSWTKPGPIPLVCAWFMIAFLGGQCPASYSLCPAP